MSYARAGPAEILRSSQRDESIIKKCEQLLDNIVLGLGGPRMSIKYKHKMQYLAHLLYFGNTTMQNLQTLGEEFTGILLINNSLKNFPTYMQRRIMVLLDCFGSSLTISFLNLLEHVIQDNNNIMTDIKIKLINILYVLKRIIPFVSHLHKAYFYFNFNTYHLSKRITGTNYMTIRHWLKDSQSFYGFKLLGIITFINLLILGLQSSKDFITCGRTPSGVGHSYQDNRVVRDKEECAKMCGMCLNDVISPSCTPCGHTYCWNCIIDWLNTDNRCPICRETVLPSRVVQLINYS